MTERAQLTSSQYIETPPEQRPTMSSVDAVALYQDFVRRNTPVPEEVKIEANRQVNENTPPGYVKLLEEYNGRLRVISFKK